MSHDSSYLLPPSSPDSAPPIFLSWNWEEGWLLEIENESELEQLDGFEIDNGMMTTTRHGNKTHVHGYPSKPTLIWRVFPDLTGFEFSSIS